METNKPRIPEQFGFYAILTNPKRGYDYLTNVAVEHSLPFLQLREKNRSKFEVLKIAQNMRKITEKSQTRLIINDHPDICVDADADGVHIGQDDLTIDKTRTMVGTDKIIGLSTHNPKQTQSASDDLKADYIGIGPVFATPTKLIADPVLGVETMAEMVRIAKLPAVCIGGITLKDLPILYRNGMRNFCMVRPVNESEDPSKIIKDILHTYQSLIG